MNTSSHTIKPPLEVDTKSVHPEGVCFPPVFLVASLRMTIRFSTTHIGFDTQIFLSSLTQASQGNSSTNSAVCGCTARPTTNPHSTGRLCQIQSGHWPLDPNSFFSLVSDRRISFFSKEKTKEARPGTSRKGRLERTTAIIWDYEHTPSDPVSRSAPFAIALASTLDIYHNVCLLREPICLRRDPLRNNTSSNTGTPLGSRSGPCLA